MYFVPFALENKVYLYTLLPRTRCTCTLCFRFPLQTLPISEVRTHKQAFKQTIYVCKTLLYEKENTSPTSRKNHRIRRPTKPHTTRKTTPTLRKKYAMKAPKLHSAKCWIPKTTHPGRNTSHTKFLFHQRPKRLIDKTVFEKDFSSH